jgi:hypothetical protein
LDQQSYKELQMNKFCLAFMVLVLLLSGMPVASARNAPTPPEPMLPAPLPGGPRPTIQVLPNHGLPGATLIVSGKGVSPYPGVRLAWLDDDVSATLQVTGLDVNGNYSAAVTIPTTFQPGFRRICAAVTGTSQAVFECANISVDSPPPGKLVGTLPITTQLEQPIQPGLRLAAAVNASLNLYDQQGNIIASAPVQSDGSYTLNKVPPGRYYAGVAGSVPVLVQNGVVVIQSGQQATYNPAPYNQCTKGSVVAVRLTPTGKATGAFDFGSYVNYWPYTEAGPKVIFEVDMQLLNGATLGLMPIKVDRPDGSVGIFAAVDPPQQGTTYQFSRWVADVDIGVRNFRFEPGVSYATQGCAVQFATRRVHIIEHPMQTNALQQYVDRRVNDLVWDGTHYVFDVKLHSGYDGYPIIIPFFSIGGDKKLPVTFPDPVPVLEYIGAQNNIIGGAAFNSVGTLDLDGNVTFQLLRVRSRSSPMNLASIINGEAPLLPEGTGLPFTARSGAQNDSFTGLPIYKPRAVDTDLVEKLRQIHYDIPPTTLFGFDEQIPVYEGVLFSAVGLVNLRISIVLGVNGDMVFQGSIRPLAPSINALATANLRPNLDVEVILDALYGVASAGGTAHTDAEVRFPVQMDSTDSRFIWMPDPCFRIKTILYLWIRANLLFTSKTWNTTPEVLVDYSQGVCQTQVAQAATIDAPSQAPPRILASPHLSSGPSGRMLAVYVEDSAPAAANPAPRVMASFWDNGSAHWGPAVALSNGSHMVQDPAAAFYGPDGKAMAVWTENPITSSEETAAGNDLNAILKRQEIYYATYNGSQWGAPQRLTNDQLPDGQAAIAGDEQGITLAWLQDADGNLATRLDWHVAVREWNPSNSTWTALVLLNGSSSDASNYQISVDRQVITSISQRVLAWTVDDDGDLGTTSDRHIVVFDWDGAAWKKDATNSLPTRVDSPQLAYLPGSQDLYIAYLSRNNDLSGSNGGLGNLGALQTARRNFGVSWVKFPVLDENGSPVHAEQPRLDVAPDGKALLLARRFGAASTNGELGQMAYSLLKDTGESYPPLYLTDEARQHWQPALAINQANSQALFLNVGRALPLTSATSTDAPHLASASKGIRPQVDWSALSTTSDPIEAGMVQPGADPALDSDLQISQLHATPGTSITVTATVRNIGRDLASGVKIGLFSGQNPSGSLIQEITVGDLAFNQSKAINFHATAATGDQPVYAKVTASSANIDKTNDLALASLGELIAPILVYVQPEPTKTAALQVAWQAPAVPGIAGYRILRSLTSGGPYELVGESKGGIYTDYLLQRGVTYYYVVQTFDASGAVSSNSLEAGGALPLSTVFIPGVY